MSEQTPEREPQSREDWEREREAQGNGDDGQPTEPSGPPPEQDEGDQDDGTDPEPDNPDGASEGR